MKPLSIKLYWAFFFLFWLCVFSAYFELELPANTLKNVLYNYVIGIFGTFILLITTYRINQSGDQKDYLKRLVCFNFPLSMRYMAIFFIPLTLLYSAQLLSRTMKACPDINNHAVFEDCVASQVQLLSDPSSIDFGFYVFSFAVFIYWFRQAFFYVSGQKPL
ncbi:MAG: hypothetical protein ACKVOE_06610 [Rickettsiales bacterium]